MTGEDSFFACLALAPAGGRAALHVAYDTAYGAVDELLLVTAGSPPRALLTLALVRQRDLLAQPAPAR